MLYTRKSFLGLGLIIPQIAIDILVMKTYYGYKRVERNIAIIININEEYINQVSRISTNWDKIKLEERFWNLSWIDLIATKSQAWQFEIYNNINERYTENKTIIDYCL